MIGQREMAGELGQTGNFRKIFEMRIGKVGGVRILLLVLVVRIGKRTEAGGIEILLMVLVVRIGKRREAVGIEILLMA